MWPFGKKKNWIIIVLNQGFYVNGKASWDVNIATRFTERDARKVATWLNQNGISAKAQPR